ncbi:MAG: hypothetical protein DRJ18_00030 [Candidatus Methanomethylicota archaeon]|nr:MAG: hypothetical protein DRJ18_00030 [Candidatus Verstraetearchaeota archaeon]
MKMNRLSIVCLLICAVSLSILATIETLHYLNIYVVKEKTVIKTVGELEKFWMRDTRGALAFSDDFRFEDAWFKNVNLTLYSFNKTITFTNSIIENSIITLNKTRLRLRWCLIKNSTFLGDGESALLTGNNIFLGIINCNLTIQIEAHSEIIGTFNFVNMTGG